MKTKQLLLHRTSIRSNAALLLLVAATSAVAGPAPIAQRFGTELEAVVAATGRYNPQSIREDREFMGAILRHDGGYTFTVGAGKPGRDRITVAITIPKGAEVVAFWHTHGARRRSNRYFSNVDPALVDRWQKRFYLADYTGFLKVMAPGAPTLSKIRAHRLGLPARAGYARGEIISDAHGEPVIIATRL
jgi:hypothetical protein